MGKIKVFSAACSAVCPLTYVSLDAAATGGLEQGPKGGKPLKGVLKGPKKTKFLVTGVSKSGQKVVSAKPTKTS